MGFSIRGFVKSVGSIVAGTAEQAGDFVAGTAKQVGDFAGGTAKQTGDAIAGGAQAVNEYAQSDTGSWLTPYLSASYALAGDEKAQAALAGTWGQAASPWVSSVFGEQAGALFGNFVDSFLPTPAPAVSEEIGNASEYRSRSTLPDGRAPGVTSGKGSLIFWGVVVVILGIAVYGWKRRK